MYEMLKNLFQGILVKQYEWKGRYFKLRYSILAMLTQLILKYLCCAPATTYIW